MITELLNSLLDADKLDEDDDHSTVDSIPDLDPGSFLPYQIFDFSKFESTHLYCTEYSQFAVSDIKSVLLHCGHVVAC